MLVYVSKRISFSFSLLLSAERVLSSGVFRSDANGTALRSLIFELEAGGEKCSQKSLKQ
jgi:hypothetical protein